MESNNMVLSRPVPDELVDGAFWSEDTRFGQLKFVLCSGLYSACSEMVLLVCIDLSACMHASLTLCNLCISLG